MKSFKKAVSKIIVIIICLLFLFPIIITFLNSFMSIQESLGVRENSILRLVPNLVSIEQYYVLLIEKYEYLNKFWVSVKFSVIITFLHSIIALITGFVFAKIKFKFRDQIFFLFIIVMMMPFQVTLLPNYLLAKKIGILYTDWAIILPSIFAPFGIFLMRQSIKYINDQYLEAVILESGSIIDILRISIIPYAKAGLVAVIVLTFADTWNMVEQPLILLKDEFKYPLSVSLNSMKSMGDIIYAGSVLYMLPIILLYFYCEDELFCGIKYVVRIK